MNRLRIKNNAIRPVLATDRTVYFLPGRRDLRRGDSTGCQDPDAKAGTPFRDDRSKDVNAGEACGCIGLGDGGIDRNDVPRKAPLKGDCGTQDFGAATDRPDYPVVTENGL